MGWVEHSKQPSMQELRGQDSWVSTRIVLVRAEMGWETEMEMEMEMQLDSQPTRQ